MTTTTYVDVWAVDSRRNVFYWGQIESNPVSFNNAVYDHLRANYDDLLLGYDTLVDRWVYDGVTFYPTEELAAKHL